jgi:hypothetical protein
MQHLEGFGWVKAFTMRSSPRVIEKLLAKGWIEENLLEGPLLPRHPSGPRCEEDAGLTRDGIAHDLPSPHGRLACQLMTWCAFRWSLISKEFAL